MRPPPGGAYSHLSRNPLTPINHRTYIITLIENVILSKGSFSRACVASALLSSMLIKNATLKIYKGAPHGLCITHQREVNEVLIQG
jgi:hypothetical protein